MLPPFGKALELTGPDEEHQHPSALLLPEGSSDNGTYNNTEISKLKLQVNFVSKTRAVSSDTPTCLSEGYNKGCKPKGHPMPVAEGWKQVSPGWDVAKEAFNCVQSAAPCPDQLHAPSPASPMQPDNQRTAIHSARD